MIAEALARDVPIVFGLNTLNCEAFLDFTGGLAVALPPEQDAITDWLKSAMDGTLTAA